MGVSCWSVLLECVVGVCCWSVLLECVVGVCCWSVLARDSKRAHWRVLALQTPPKFHAKTPRERERKKKKNDRKWGGRGKTKREMFAPLPTVRGLPPFGSHPPTPYNHNCYYDKNYNCKLNYDHCHYNYNFYNYNCYDNQNHNFDFDLIGQRTRCWPKELAKVARARRTTPWRERCTSPAEWSQRRTAVPTRSVAGLLSAKCGSHRCRRLRLTPPASTLENTRQSEQPRILFQVLSRRIGAVQIGAPSPRALQQQSGLR